MEFEDSQSRMYKDKDNNMIIIQLNHHTDGTYRS